MSTKNRIAWSVGALFVLLIGIISFNNQPRDQVLIREPGYRLYNPGPILGESGKEWEYAILAENVYVDTSTEVAPVTLSRHRAACDDTTRTRRIPLADWTKWENFPSDSLIAEVKKAHTGLVFEVWETKSSPLRLAVVFRGTDGWSDWPSNLHWFTRFIPFFKDQYSVVSELVGKEFSGRILADPIKYSNPERLPLVSAGHSLGGGLAQHFAYALGVDPRVPRVSQVYAFDPSPVTGWSSVPKDVRESNAHRLKIDRIFEHGEILAYLRLVMSYVNPPSAVDPSVREVRYNFEQTLNPFKGHSMRALACDLVDAAGHTPTQ